MLTITLSTGGTLDIYPDDNSYRYRKIMGENSINLTFSLAEHTDIPIGSTVQFGGGTYTLYQPAVIKKIHSRNFEYTAYFEAVQARLSKYKFKDKTHDSPLSGRLKFSLTAKPYEHLQFLIDNLNERDGAGVWVMGEYIDATEKVISYNHNYCLEALTMMAQEFDTEWEINGTTISLGKVEHNKGNPIPLSYGKGNGFRSGVGRQNTNDKPPVERLWVQGGERNIDYSKYGNRELLLPISQPYTYEDRQYITDEQGLSIIRADKQLKSNAEDSFDGSNIYPSRAGEVSSVISGDLNEEGYYPQLMFDDNGIPADLDFVACLIDGQTLTVEFQTGMLTGKTFDIKFQKSASGTPNLNRFTLVPQEIDGVMMPNEQFKPEVGQKYAVFGMQMPDQYICDNNTKTGASWDLYKEAVKYFYENEDPKFTFIGELDPIYARANWNDLQPKLLLGGYIDFSDPQFQPEGIPIRITGIKDYINNPYYPTLELSNDVVGGTVANELGTIKTNEVLAETNLNGVVQMFNRSWHQVKETQAMLEAAMLDGFDVAVNPIAVNTMQLIAGSPQCQFYFVSGKPNPPQNPNPHQVSYQPVWNINAKQLTFSSGVIKHLTMGITAVAKSHAPDEYHYFSIPKATFSLTDPNKTYYVYAYASPLYTMSAFKMSETPLSYLDEKEDFYNMLAFLVGAEQADGTRQVTRVFGFTEVLPGQITTDMIRSSDGKTYFDLVNNIVRGRFDFKDGLISSMIQLGDDENTSIYPVTTYLFNDIVLSNSGNNYQKGDILIIELDLDIYQGNALFEIKIAVDNVLPVILGGGVSMWHIISNELKERNDIITDFAGTVTPYDNGNSGGSGARFSITTTIIPAKGSNITAGLQGDRNVNVGLWLGGTYQEAVSGKANVILYKDGMAKIGVFDVLNDAVNVRDDNEHKILQIFKRNIPDNISFADNVNTIGMSNMNIQWTRYSILDGSDISTGMCRVYLEPITNYFTIEAGTINVSILTDELQLSVNNPPEYPALPPLSPIPMPSSFNVTFRAFLMDLNYDVIELSGYNLPLAIPTSDFPTSPMVGQKGSISLWVRGDANNSPLVISNVPPGMYKLVFAIDFYDYNKQTLPSNLAGFFNTYFSRSKENAIQFPSVDIKSTFIGKNGFAYLNSNQEYFRVEKPDGGDMKVAIRGDWKALVESNIMKINTPTLSDNPQILSSGDWYQDNDGFIKRKP